MPNFEKLDRTGNKALDLANDLAYHTVSLPGKIAEAVANELLGSSSSSQTQQSTNSSDSQQSNTTR
jgi:hypothetical protein